MDAELFLKSLSDPELEELTQKLPHEQKRRIDAGSLAIRHAVQIGAAVLIDTFAADADPNYRPITIVDIEADETPSNE